LTKENLITEYNKLTTDIEKLDATLEATKAKRSALVTTILTQHGKGPYDLGTGEEMVISVTKAKTHFFTPKDKWSKKKAAGEVGQKAREAKKAREAEELTKDVILSETPVPAAPVANNTQVDPLSAALAEAKGV